MTGTEILMGITVKAETAHQRWMFATLFKMLADECDKTGLVLDAPTLRLLADQFARSAEKS